MLKIFNDKLKHYNVDKVYGLKDISNPSGINRHFPPANKE